MNNIYIYIYPNLVKYKQEWMAIFYVCTISKEINWEWTIFTVHEWEQKILSVNEQEEMILWHAHFQHLIGNEWEWMGNIIHDC